MLCDCHMRAHYYMLLTFPLRMLRVFLVFIVVTLHNISIVFCTLQCVCTYVFQNGALSTSLLFLQSLQVPCQVTGVTLKPEPPMDEIVSMMVTWTAPRSYANISMYYVQYKRTGITFWGSQTVVAGSPPPTCSQLKGLSAGTLYDVRVKALSTAGHGPWSAAQTGRTYGGKCCMYHQVLQMLHLPV